MYDAKSGLNSVGFKFTKSGSPGLKTLSPGPGAYSATDSIVKG